MEELEQITTAYNKLKECAKMRQLILYGELYGLIGLDHRLQSDLHKGSIILTKVNEISMEEASVMITSLATMKDTSRPGEGYFTLAKEWGKLKDNAKDEEKEEFWWNECGKVCAFYK